MVMIQLKNVAVSRGERRLLNGVDFVLRRGEHVALLGGNGAGKTTLLRVLRGEIPPDDGGERAYNFGSGLSESPLGIWRRIALVTGAEHEFFRRHGPKATGLEVVLGAFIAEPFPQGPQSEDRLAAAHRALALTAAEALAEMRVGEMSTGQLARVLLARGMATEPDVLLLDEAFDGLDAEGRTYAFEALEAVLQQATVVCAAHREEDIPPAIVRAVYMRAGRTVRDPGSETLSRGELSAMIDELLPSAPCKVGETLVRIQRADVVKDGAEILRDADWIVRSGERWAVVGENGAGKTTLFNLALGLEAPYAEGERTGRVEWYRNMTPGAFRRRVGLVSPDLQEAHGREPHEYLTALECVVSGLRGEVGLYYRPGEKEETEARQWLHVLGVEELEARQLRTLSTGQLRRVLLARALAVHPVALFLDEPFSGLDAESRHRMAFVLDTVWRKGIAVVHVTHHPEDIGTGEVRTLRLEKGCAVAESRA